MSLPYFITDAPGSGQLAGTEGRHAVTVKRIAPGEQIVLTDGHGAWARVEVTATTGKEWLTGTVLEQGVDEPPTPRVIVVQAIPKSERAELAVDLATQAGADAFIPWISHRTIARWQGTKVEKNVEKWQNTAREAAKQSRRTFIPPVHQPLTTNQLREVLVDKRALVLHEDATQSIKAVLASADLTSSVGGKEDVEEIYLLVGPEGGISPEELELLGATPVKLGPEVLRTATAAAIGLAAIGVLSGRWD